MTEADRMPINAAVAYLRRSGFYVTVGRSEMVVIKPDRSPFARLNITFYRRERMVSRQLVERVPTRRNYEEMAILNQRLAAQSHHAARLAMQRCDLSRAAYYQRQSARDHKTMRTYLDFLVGSL